MFCGWRRRGSRRMTDPREPIRAVSRTAASSTAAGSGAGMTPSRTRSGTDPAATVMTHASRAGRGDSRPVAVEGGDAHGDRGADHGVEDGQHVSPFAEFEQVFWRFAQDPLQQVDGQRRGQHGADGPGDFDTERQHAGQHGGNQRRRQRARHEGGNEQARLAQVAKLGCGGDEHQRPGECTEYDAGVYAGRGTAVPDR